MKLFLAYISGFVVICLIILGISMFDVNATLTSKGTILFTVTALVMWAAFITCGYFFFYRKKK